MSILVEYVLAVIINLLLSTISYEYFLDYKISKPITKSLLASKVTILVVGVFDLLFLLFFVQLLLMSITPLTDLVYDYFPSFLLLFISFAWIESAKEGYYFCIEIIIYLTIVCSLLEYSTLRKKRKEINTSCQMIKAVLAPNMITMAVILVLFVWLYHLNPSTFILVS